MPNLLKSGLLALIVGIMVSCDSSAAASRQKAATIATAIDAAAVLDEVYGAPREGVWTWTVPADAPSGDGQDLRGHKVEVRSLMSAHFVQGGHERFLVVTGMIDPRNNCHGCETLIGAAVYTLDVQRAIWHPGPIAAALALAGSFGRPPEVSFEQLGPDVYGFGTTDTWAGTGDTDNRLTLWLARQRGFVPILSVHRFMTGELLSQPPVWDCQVVRHDIHIMPETLDGLFDLALRISAGTLRTTSDTVDACLFPLSTAADFKQLKTVLHYDSAHGRYCQEAALPGITSQAQLCRH
jgi:hypothetical protein